MKKTLYLKFIIAYLIFGTFGFICVATFMHELTADQVKTETAQTFYNAATEISKSYAVDLYNNETSLVTLKDELESFADIINASILIVNPSGLIILDSDSPINIDKPSSIDAFDPTAFVGSYYSIGYFYNLFNTEHLVVAAPITTGFNIQGYVIVHTDMANILQKTNNYLNINYILLAIVFLLSLIILIFFTEIVYIPIRKITRATEEYASGNLHYEFSIDSDDEIGYLAASLSYMAKELSKGEDNQKQLVANVSHDFRSPLTSVKGYLEAIKDGTIPPENQEKYIDIVLNETDRLIKLTNNLLTLNNLNTEGMVLEKVDFNINDTIRQSLSTFEGKCREKKISVNLMLTGEIMKVNADKTRISQVLYNLIDNAIKFSHKDSSIEIETTEKRGKLFVSVKDSGIGIPEESIGLVFDRFYKTDISRGKDKKGTGLGLSITREIIRAHGENINVISTEGVGTEFIFTLPISNYMDDDNSDEDSSGIL